MENINILALLAGAVVPMVVGFIGTDQFSEKHGKTL